MGYRNRRCCAAHPSLILIWYWLCVLSFELLSTNPKPARSDAYLSVYGPSILKLEVIGSPTILNLAARGQVPGPLGMEGRLLGGLPHQALS